MNKELIKLNRIKVEKEIFEKDIDYYRENGIFLEYDINDTNNYETKITPTFVFYRENNEIGRITGYSSAEMFWWQVDEILDRD